MTKTIHRALISVYDKTGLNELAQVLAKHAVETISTGGTIRFLQERGIAVTPVEKVTGFPEILGGRVKTLHPMIMGGLLARRDLPGDQSEVSQHNLPLIDLVVVNLYPFREAVAKPEISLDEALENIDIGGVALIRAAAKNFPHVAVLTHPDQYSAIIAELNSQNGALSAITREKLAISAYAHTAFYDAAIHRFLHERAAATEKSQLPSQLILSLEKVQDLRYGENPHQAAALYREASATQALRRSRQLQGKELSYNNLVDADAAFHVANAFDEPGCAIVKHANPCGVAIADSVASAYQLAKATDPVSAFGGIIGFNREVDRETAELASELFAEVILAPAFSGEALQVFSKKKNLRVLETYAGISARPELELKRVSEGVLLQQQDLLKDDVASFRVVSQRKPNEDEWQAMRFGWKVVRWVKSNAIVYCDGHRTLGIGAGQMSRIDSALFAQQKAAKAGLSLQGAAMASDAFFPFSDNVEAAAAAGITAIIQPGGSIRDAEVIAKADECDIAMVFTGARHFRH